MVRTIDRFAGNHFVDLIFVFALNEDFILAVIIGIKIREFIGLDVAAP
jgi:hypothetical protein